MSFGDIISWPGEQASIGLFVSSQSDDSVSDLFKLAFGEAPNQLNENLQQGGRVGQAALHGTESAKIVAVQPGRVDVSIQGSEQNMTPSGPPPTFGNVADAVVKVLEASKRLLPSLSLSGYHRLAAHCRMTQFFRTVQEANQAIMKVVPPKLALTDETDFIFQINSKSRLAGIPVNRLVKWSVEDIQLVASTQMGPGLSPHQTFAQYFAAVVHMDFNSMPSHMGHDAAQAGTILDELTAEVVRVRRNSLRFR